MFIRATLLIRVSTGETIHSVDAPVASLDEMIALLPPRDRPTPEQRGDYALRYELEYYYLPIVRGKTASGAQVVDVQFWRNQSDFQSGQPPVLSNTFVLTSSLTNKEGVRDALLYHIDRFIERADLAGRLGDQRDRRIRLESSDKGRLATFDGQPRERTR